MNFLRVLLAIIFSIAYPACFSQENIRGRISMKTQEDLAFVQILLRNSTDSSILKTIQPDSLGNFSVAIKNNDHSMFLEASALGYTSEYLSITPPKNDTFEWKVVLDIQQQQLNDIVISSKSPLIERKVDRIIFNVANSIASNGSDAYELLKKTPGVQISRDNIGMTGKSTVSIMIDNRLVQTDGEELEALLRSMPSTEIDKIEVISAPPAKNDAQGNSGIINIIKKKKDAMVSTEPLPAVTSNVQRALNIWMPHSIIVKTN